MTGPLTFPRRPVVEWFLDGDWRDISGDVRQDPGITIIPGRKDEAAKTPPAKCTFVLDDGPEHGDGNHNPENAGGEWFGELGRNTPVRVALEYGDDDFERVSASGWGSSSTMGAWSTFTGAGTLSSDIFAGQGRHQITTTASFFAHYLPSVSVRDVDVSVTGNLQAATVVAGGALEFANLMVRGQDTTNYYLLRVEITTAQRLEARIMVGGSTTVVGPVDCGPYNGLSSPLGVRFQADGHTLRGKVWETLSGEPVGWNVEIDRVTPFGAGWVGIRSGVAGGNTNTKPIQFLYDTFTVRLPRFAGFTAKMVPTTTVDHKAPVVSVEAAGLLRIVRQGTTSIGTAFRRYLDSGAVTLVDFWPLDELPEAGRQGVNAVPGGAPTAFRRETSSPLVPKGAIKWAATDGLLSLAKAPQLTEGGYLTLPVQSEQFGTQWSASWMQKISADSGGSCWLRTQNSPGPGDVSFVFYTDGFYEVYLVASPSDVLLFSGTFSQYGFDDVWHSIKFSYVFESATEVLFILGVDDNQQTGVIAGPVTYAPLLRFEAQAEPTSTAPSSYAQVAVFTDRIDALVPDPLGTTTTVTFALDQAYRGWPTESAAARFARLCSEQGVSHTIVGSPTISPQMGPQRDLPLIDQLHECVDVDQGTLFEPKGHPALGLVTTRALVEKSPALVLDYAAKEVAPTFGPIRDDQRTVNDVTAKRLGGDKYRVEKTTGPLNVNDPGTVRGGVGRVDKAPTVNVLTDGDLADQAGWRVHLGTVDEPRFSNVTVNLAADAFRNDLARTAAVLDVAVDDIVHVTGAQAARIYDDVRQVARGWTEKLDTAYLHTITFNTTPESPYDSGALDDGEARLDSDSSTLAADFDAGTDTSMSVETTGPRWTTDPAEFPLEVRVAGVVFEVTAISGSSAPFGITQTFTVTAAPVNGVPAKTIRAGTPVTLASPVYLTP